MLLPKDFQCAILHEVLSIKPADLKCREECEAHLQGFISAISLCSLISLTTYNCITILLCLFFQCMSMTHPGFLGIQGSRRKNWGGGRGLGLMKIEGWGAVDPEIYLSSFHGLLPHRKYYVCIDDLFH